MIDIKQGSGVMIGDMEKKNEKVKSFAEDRFIWKMKIGMKSERG